MGKASIDPVNPIDSPSKGAIVFVHGFTGSGKTTWEDIAPRLMSEPELKSWDGWLITYSSSPMPDIFRNLWSSDASIDQLALQVITDVTKGTLSDYESVVLIAHSMGGLVIQRALLDSKELRDKTFAVIMYGTPSAGLAKASFIEFWKKQISDMAHDGYFIKKLRDDWSAEVGEEPLFRFLAVRGQKDEFVPETSSSMPFLKKYRASIPGNHTGMLVLDESETGAIDVARNCILGKEQKLANYDSVSFALEIKEFQQIVNDLEPTVSSLDEDSLVDLAIALDAIGRQEDAQKFLMLYADKNSDAFGSLGGRLKRYWLSAGRIEKIGESAEKYYKKGYEIAKEANSDSQIYYLGINLAFLAFVFRKSSEQAEVYANEVLEACERSISAGKNDDWVKATQAEANLILRNFGEAYRLYDEYVNSMSKLWKISSTYLNAIEIAAELDQAEVVNRIEEIFVKAT